jgi:LysR family transcriptional regulator, glycine cleavage system transcriptional activator
MKRVLPSMTALQAFDAAARAGSFTAAAHELNLTQGAVSKQIIVMAASLRVLTNPDGGTLELAVLPTFGSRWLMPRLGDFIARHPRVQVNVVTKLAPFDFRLVGLHAAIHYGKPNWPHAECTYLMGEHVTPVCSPGFKARHDMKEPADLLELPLLQISSRPGAWAAWFAGQGIACEEPGGMAFEQFLAAAQAAVADIGVALLPRFLVEYEIGRGELVVAFRQWLLDTIAAERAGAGDTAPEN